MKHPPNRGERRRITEELQSSRIKEFEHICRFSLSDSARGMCRKKKPFDCGKPGCFCCHSEPKQIHKKRCANLSWTEER